MRSWLLPAGLTIVAALATAGCGGSSGSGASTTGGRGPGSGGTASGGRDGATGGLGSGGILGSGGSATGGQGTGSGGAGPGGTIGSGGAVGSGGNGGTGGGGRGGGGAGGTTGPATGGSSGSGGSGGTGGPGGGAGVGLSFDPPEGIYSVALSITTAGVPKTFALHNGSASPVMITAITVSGADAARFVLEGRPTLPASIRANGDLSITVRFLPSATSATTTYAALLTASGATTASTASAGLYGLAMNTGNSEATLDQVVKTLGYAVNVGGTTLTLGTGSALIGDEVAAKRFMRAGAAGLVGLQPVARYSPFEAAAYGYYTGTNPAVVRHALGTMSKGPADNVANRTLSPPLDPGAMLTFDPGSGSFGLFAESQANTASLGADGRLYQEDSLNDDQAGVLPIHRVRVYPLKNRTGQLVSNSFLLVCEEASNSDYQDYVFVVSNVTIAPN